MTKVLIADDEASIRTILSKTAEKRGLTCVCIDNGKKALEILTTEPVEVALIDIRMPELSGLEILDYQNSFFKKTQIIVMTAQDTMENAVSAMKRGAFDYVTKPFDLEEVGILIDRAIENFRMVEELSRLRYSENCTIAKTSLIGRTRAMQEIFKTIGRVADQDVTVLIQGESGTGKELVARALHYQGIRADKPFVAVNCSAIPQQLLESELFGHRRGSFTGAVEDKIGFLERANHGSIFLDEISEMPMSLQAKLLRFLQDKSIQRVGESQTKTLNVRVIAATNRRIEDDVKKGRFREDLFFRLNVVPIRIPPLRERREDIRLLMGHFLQKYGRELLHEEKQFSPDAVEFFVQAPWPGNVRQLENTVKRALVLSRGAVITRLDIQAILGEEDFDPAGPVLPAALSIEDYLEKKLSEIIERAPQGPAANLYETCLPFLERPLLKLILKKTRGNQIQAAQILGINRNTLRKKIRALGLK